MDDKDSQVFEVRCAGGLGQEFQYAQGGSASAYALGVWVGKDVEAGAGGKGAGRLAFCYLFLESFCLVSVGGCEDYVVPADERLVVQGADVVFSGILGGLGEEEGFWGLVFSCM